MAGNPLMNLMGGGNPLGQNMMNNNPMMNGFGNLANFMKQFSEFKKSVNITPEEAKSRVMKMRDAGQITDEQIEQARQFANMLGIK